MATGSRNGKAKAGFKAWSNDARESEFSKLYKESYELVFNYVYTRMAGDPAVEDIVAEAYLNAARYFDRYDRTRAKFSTWVIKIASNLMISNWRKTRPTTNIDDLPERVAAQPAEQDEFDDRDFVNQLLGVLDDTERELVLMKYREGYRNVEIAEELGMNASTVSTKLANALAKMRVVAEKGMRVS